MRRKWSPGSPVSMWCWQEAPRPSCWVRIKEVLSGAQKAALGLAGGEPEPEVEQWPEVKEKGTD